MSGDGVIQLAPGTGSNYNAVNEFTGLGTQPGAAFNARSAHHLLFNEKRFPWAPALVFRPGPPVTRGLGQIPPGYTPVFRVTDLCNKPAKHRLRARHRAGCWDTHLQGKANSATCASSLRAAGLPGQGWAPGPLPSRGLSGSQHMGARRQLLPITLSVSWPLPITSSHPCPALHHLQSVRCDSLS